MDISEPYCPGKTGGEYSNHPMGGDIPVTATAVFLYDSAPFTAIAAMPVNKYTAVFLGTEHGHLLKVHFGSLLTKLLKCKLRVLLSCGFLILCTNTVLCKLFIFTSECL